MVGGYSQGDSTGASEGGGDQRSGGPQRRAIARSPEVGEDGGGLGR